jgi:hypothetical protein
MGLELPAEFAENPQTVAQVQDELLKQGYFLEPFYVGAGTNSLYLPELIKQGMELETLADLEPNEGYLVLVKSKTKDGKYHASAGIVKASSWVHFCTLTGEVQDNPSFKVLAAYALLLIHEGSHYLATAKVD